ncbi:MAG: class I SAM-dependent RNA methyltransferase [Pararhodobacter sp.]|nr:class I SAM-dependent RNA methyltransferase [Pararhodobacter sp.]
MITIERLNLRGEGVARETFVARALPGELVEGEAEDGRIARPHILTPSPRRVAAPCAHYRNCGGCALQHADDAFVAEWKAGVLHRALEGQGLEAPFRQAHCSPPGARRRATLAGRRLKSGALVGFHGRASDVVTAVPGCLLLSPSLMAALPALEALVEAGGTRKGEVALAVTALEGGVDVAARGGRALDAGLRRDLPRIASAHALARLTWDGELLYQPTPPLLRMGRAQVQVPPGAFLQATAEGEAALVAAVRAALGMSGEGGRPPEGPVADLFAGCGTFALPLAEAVPVHALEGDGAALEALDTGWRGAEGLKRVTTERRDLFRRPLMPEELARFAALVIDPPRAGAAAQMGEIARAAALGKAPGVIAMVSCNPVTFARDAKVLAGAGYRLDWVQMVDQFRWSAHVELAARLSRGHIARN